MTANFSLYGSVVPKARPRVTANGTFMPHRYQQWKREAITALILQAQEMGLAQPLSAAAVNITLLGKHPRRGDLDNISGSILDALVQSGVLKDDSVAVVWSLAIALYWSKESPSVEITLTHSMEEAA